MMTHFNKKFVLGMLVGAILGCTLVLIIWLTLLIENHRSEGRVVNQGSGNALPLMPFSYDFDSWRSLLQTTETSLTLSDYIKILEEKSADDLSRLAVQSLELEQDKEVHLLQELVISTLAHKSPQSTLDLIWKFPWNRHQKLINIFVGTLSTFDLEQTLEIAEIIPNSYQEDAIRTILSSHAEFSDSDWNELTEDATVSRLLVRLLREAEAIVQLDQPSVAWDQLLHDDVENDDQKDLLTQIAIARVEEEGFAVLSHLYETLYQNDRLLLESIVREVVDPDPQIAFHTVHSMPYESKKFVLPILIEAWAIQNPKEAYFALTEIAGYQQLFVNTFTTFRKWSKLDPLDVLDSLNEIERSDRDSAVSAAFSELAKTNPDVMIQRLEELKNVPGVSADDLEWRMVARWSEYEPLKALNWIQESTVIGSRLQSRMLSRVLGELVSVDVDKAWEIALKQPTDSYFVRDGQIGRLFFNLVNEGYLDKAINSLNDLPEAAIYRGYSSVGRGLIEADRWSDALKLVDSLKTDNRESYIRSIASTAAYRNMPGLIDQLKEMPDNEIRRYMADELVRLNEWSGDFLTEQQLELVQSLLPTENQNSELNGS